jgi:uncharacterized protein with HEPN domain
MRPESLKLLEDIRDAAQFIRDQTARIGIEAYLENRLLRQAVERNFEIIGEALGRLHRVDRDTANLVPGAAQAIAFRNVLIHGYDDIDQERVWAVIHDSLPKLEREVVALISKSPDQID